MKNILFLGDYFPNYTMSSIRNNMIAKKMKSDGLNVFLVSDAWCNLENITFSKFKPIENPFITEIYYADPIQVRFSNTNVALIALSKMVCQQNQINYIFISNLHKYGFIGEVVSSYFHNIPIVTSFHADGSINCIYEPYSKSWIDGYFAKPGFLLTHSHYGELLRKYHPFRTIIPYVLPHSGLDSNCINNFVIWGGYSDKITDYLIEQVINLKQYAQIKLLAWQNENEKVKKMIRENNEIQLLSFENSTEVLSGLCGSIFINIGNLLGECEQMVDLSILMLCYGLFPLINSTTEALLNYYYDPSILTYMNKYHILTSIKCDPEQNNFNLYF